MGSSTPIPDDDVNLVNNHTSKGHVELSEAEYFKELNQQLINQEIQREEIWKKSQEKYGLPEWLPETDLFPRNDLPEALQQSAFQIVRARESLNALNAEMRAYELSNPCSLVTETAVDGEVVRKIHIRPPSYKLRSLVGDVVVHCRQALDYISWGLIDGTVRNPQGHDLKELLHNKARGIQFPVVLQDADDPTLTSKERREIVNSIDRNTGRKIRIKGGGHHRIISAAAEQIILAGQPWDGWDNENTHPLELLQAIGNGHKHRMLTLTDMAVHAHIARIAGVPAINFSTVKLENNSVYDMRGVESFFDGMPKEITPDNFDIEFYPAIDITIKKAPFTVKRIFNNTTPIPIESGMECCLHDIILWVEGKWSEFSQQPNLFTEADAR